MRIFNKKILLYVLVLLFVAASACLFGWRVMPGIWKWTKSLFVKAVIVEQEPYKPVSTAVLQETFDGTDSVIYYFYKDNCRYCEEIDAFFKGLPEQVLLQDGSISQVELVCVNKNTDEAVCKAYYDAYGIPESEQYVPAVVVGGTYLFTPSEILEGVYRILLAGEAMNTPMLGDNVRGDL